ncbi:rhodanese-like domain-containing protein [Bdellovibrio bacteriovorus]|uniref:rhodanese-like domain-containing protein n=1 Tax=Bdellovibrio bacteriovorus TaxID=959 RepID=UPI001E54F07C|nr:rhodanese-like domain-containing protein [Bdellovibrio bacteriovorus]
MKLKLLMLLTVVLSCGCQTRPGPIQIDLPQLKSYLSQKNEVAQWSTKARMSSLGGRAPSQQLAPTFGMPFSQAKLKAHVLDVRREADFVQFNMSMDPITKMPVSNIPASTLKPLSAEEATKVIAAKGMTPESIIIVVCSQGGGAPDIARQIFTWGYTRVLNYPGDYSGMAGCQNEE